MTPSQSSYRIIALTRGQVAKVSPEDYEQLNARKWSSQWAKNTRSFYAICGSTKTGGRLRMHRVILGLQKGDVRFVDHINGDTLDNRRSNLRIATVAQNNRNQRLHLNNTSGFKGASFHARIKKWRSYIREEGKQTHLGYFPTPEAAHEAYRIAATRLYKEFAKTE